MPRSASYYHFIHIAELPRTPCRYARPTGSPCLRHEAEPRSGRRRAPQAGRGRLQTHLDQFNCFRSFGDRLLNLSAAAKEDAVSA